MFDTSLGLNKCSVCIAHETIHGWQKSTWGVCAICGHGSVVIVTDPELVMNVCLDCGAHETAVGWRAGHRNPCEPERKMTTKERRQMYLDIQGQVTAVLGYIDLSQNPEPGQQVDRDVCLSKARVEASRALKHAQELLRDGWQENADATMTMQDVREEN